MPRKPKNTEDESLVGQTSSMVGDQNEILDEVGARVDEESGEVLVDEDRIAEIGAVDTDSVRENRRAKKFTDSKRGGKKGITFNTDDVLQKYDVILATWPANTIDISVRRLTGAPVMHMILSRPRSGAELYEAIKTQVHKDYNEADYEISFSDSVRKEWRGKGRITMPDSRPVGGAPVNQPQQAPVAPPAAPVQDMSSMVGTMQQMFELFQRMQPQQPPQPTAPPPPAPMQMPPQPASNDPAAQMVWVQQMFELFQRMQPQVPGAPPLPPIAAPQMAAVGVPPVQPPTGTMHVPGFGYVPVARLMQAIGAVPPPEPRGAPRGSYDPRESRFGLRGGYDDSRRRYDPRDDPRGGYDPRDHRDPRDPRGGYDSRDPRGGYDPRNQPQPQPQPRSPTDELREAMSVVRTTMQALQEIQTLMPGQPQQAEVQESTGQEDDDDSPVQVIDVGGAKLLVDKKSGDARMLESLWASAPGAAKWIGEQMQTWSKAQAKQQPQQQRQQPRRLPPNYVEVTEGYEPPPGYTAVPVDDIPLPAPPQNMPPPVRQQEPEEQQEEWGEPPTPPWAEGD